MCEKGQQTPCKLIGIERDSPDNTICVLCNVEIFDSKYNSYYRDTYFGELGPIICSKCYIQFHYGHIPFNRYCIEHLTLFRPCPQYIRINKYDECPECFVRDMCKLRRLCQICYSYLVFPAIFCNKCTHKQIYILHQLTPTLPTDVIRVILNLWYKTRAIYWWATIEPRKPKLNSITHQTRVLKSFMQIRGTI